MGNIQQELQKSMTRSRSASASQGFTGMTADTRAIERKFAELMKAVGDEREQMRIHRKVGRLVANVMKKEIIDYPEVIKVRRSGGANYDIEPGTLRRSVSVWRIKGETGYWVGPRATGRLDRRDGWFSGIVESGLQAFGAGQNEGVFEESKRKSNAAAQAMLEAEYREVIRKGAKR